MAEGVMTIELDGKTYEVGIRRKSIYINGRPMRRTNFALDTGLRMVLNNLNGEYDGKED